MDGKKKDSRDIEALKEACWRVYYHAEEQQNHATIVQQGALVLHGVVENAVNALPDAVRDAVRDAIRQNIPQPPTTQLIMRPWGPVFFGLFVAALVTIGILLIGPYRGIRAELATYKAELAMYKLVYPPPGTARPVLKPVPRDPLDAGKPRSVDEQPGVVELEKAPVSVETSAPTANTGERSLDPPVSGTGAIPGNHTPGKKPQNTEGVAR